MAAMFESMFDISLPDAADLAEADDATVVAAIGVCARAEAAVAARRLAAIAELAARRAHHNPGVDTDRWSCDNWDAITAEVGAAHRISHPTASQQMYLALALRTRLHNVSALLAGGTISARLARTIVWHTDLITDPTTLNLVDGALAADAARFGPLSVPKTAQAIDAIVARHDPAAVRRTRDEARDRHVTITNDDRGSGTAALWGRLFASDAAVLERRLAAIAAAVCEHDPRTTAQRRADALGALAAGGEHLACGCGRPECPTPRGDARASAVVIHVLADPATLATPHSPRARGDGTPGPACTTTPDPQPAAEPTPEPAPGARFAPAAPPGFLFGGGTVPAPLLARLVTAGATVRALGYPTTADIPAEPGYRPSATLARFIRCRDMTCRFPGCDNPVTDIDHTIPWPLGPTHPSNLALKCRKHHLLKTFWTGWQDRQYPDGTLEWTSPTGHTYTTHPGSRLLFPALCLPTGDLPTPDPTPYPTPDPTPDPTPAGSPARGLAMPTRRRTRAQDRAQRFRAERDHNTRRITEQETRAQTDTPSNAPPRSAPDYDDDPPPF